MKAHPMVRIIVGEVDRGLNTKKYIVPGETLNPDPNPERTKYSESI